jgi:cell division septation protein DedD
MRGSVAEQKNAPSTTRGDGHVNGARGSGGYTLRPSSQGERLRSSGSGWEIRLGTLQVAVWLGLAVGACVGGYFVGFFSGRYVGFESARQASSSEVPKLPAPEMFTDSSAVNPNRVYDKLKAPAVLPDSASARASAKVGEIVRNGEGTSRIDAPESGDTKRLPQGASTTGPIPTLGSSDDDIFGEVASGERLIIGADSGLDEEIEEKSPSTVRMLGKTKDVTEAPPATSTSAAAAVVLNERIANARNEAARIAERESALNQEARKVVDEPRAKPVENKSADSGSLVRKVLPQGYFAQVSAPKKLAEAEAVARKLKRSGFPVLVESASVSGQSFYRVLVGPEENKVQAERLVSQLQSESFVASKPFIRKVK